MYFIWYYDILCILCSWDRIGSQRLTCTSTFTETTPCFFQKPFLHHCVFGVTTSRHFCASHLSARTGEMKPASWCECRVPLLLDRQHAWRAHVQLPELKPFSRTKNQSACSARDDEMSFQKQGKADSEQCSSNSFFFTATLNIKHAQMERPSKGS